MNDLTSAEVLAQDRLATLDTRTARMNIDHRHEVVLSDTVGFIRSLPHKLIASFHATLAEVIEADLLLHVVDASLPGMKNNQAVEDVLAEIGAKEVPTIMVLIKPMAHSQTLTLAFRHRYPGSVMVSAKTGEGMDTLKNRILNSPIPAKKYVVRFNAASLCPYAFLQGRCKVIEEDYEENSMVLTIAADDRTLEDLKENEDCHIEEVPSYIDPWVSTGSNTILPRSTPFIHPPRALPK